MSSEIPELDNAGLRHFAFIFAILVAGLFGLIFPLLFDIRFALWPWLVGLGFVLWGSFAPGTVRRFYHAWMRFGFIMGAIMSRVVLGIVYYLTVVPVGLILRFRGKDPMRRVLQPDADSYRVESESLDSARMRKPY